MPARGLSRVARCSTARSAPRAPRRSAAVRIDQEIGPDHLVGAAVGAAEHPRAGDAATVGRRGEPDGVAAAANLTFGRALTRARPCASRNGRLAHTTTSPQRAC